MRTTLTLDDDLFVELRERAHREGVSLKLIVNRTLRRGLDPERRSRRHRPYKATTCSMGSATVPTLDKGLDLAATLEDEELARKLALRK